MQELAALLLEKSREGRIRWLNGLRRNEYIAGVEDLNFRISGNQGNLELILIDDKANRAGEATPDDGPDMTATLKEILALAEEQVRNRTIRKATQYLQELEREKPAEEGQETLRKGWTRILPFRLPGARRARREN